MRVEYGGRGNADAGAEIGRGAGRGRGENSGGGGSFKKKKKENCWGRSLKRTQGSTRSSTLNQAPRATYARARQRRIPQSRTVRARASDVTCVLLVRTR